MASIATDVKWGSSPEIYFNFSYSKQRSGTTQQYKITVQCEALTGTHYFGYPIYLEITVDGKVAATKTLKSASPSQWSSALSYTTDWISVANKVTGTTPLKIRIYSGSGSTRNTTYSYSLAIDPAASKISATNAYMGSASTVTFTRYNSAFTHTLSYKATGQSSYTTIFSKQNKTSYSWTIPTSLCSLVASGKTTLSITLQCQTYSGSTLVGTNTCTLTATAIPSKISATNANIGSASTVTFTRYNSAFTHTLSYKAAGQSSYTAIFSKQNKTSYSWTIPTALCSLIKTGKTLSITLQCQTYNGSVLVGTTTCTLTATAIPSKMAATDANIESVSTVTFTRYNSAFTHTLSYKAAGQSSYTAIFSKQNVASYAWTVPKALYALIPNAPEIVVTLQCQTFNGSTLIGTTTCEMIATAAKIKCAPSVSVTAVDNNTATKALTGNEKKIIRYHSDVKVTAKVSANNEADIKKTTLKCGGKSATATTYTFADAESVDVSATTTDTRGYSTTAKASGLTLINYIKLTANTTITRTSPTGDEITVTTKGNYFNGSFGAVANTLNVQLRYKLTTNSGYNEYQDMTVTISGNTYTATITLTGFDYDKTYNITVRASDKIYYYDSPLTAVFNSDGSVKSGGAVYNKIVLKKGIPVYDWGENDFNFNVPVDLVGSQFFAQNKYGLNANNSDIVGLNALYFRDACGSNDEGVNFYRDGTNWDILYALNGNVYIKPNCPANTKAYLICSPNNKPYFEAGDTTSVNTIYAGVVTSGRKDFLFTIPLTKPIIANSASVSGSIMGRGINGYVLDSSNNPVNLAGGTGYTVECAKTHCGLRVKLTYTAEQTAGVTNNTPVNWYGTITITFS